MASASVAPPEGFVLDAQTDNAMLSNAGEVAASAIAGPYFWMRGSGQRLKDIGNAMLRPVEGLIQRGYQPGQNDEQAVSDALAASGMAMTGGLARAGMGGAVSELGSAGGRARMTPNQVEQIMRDIGYQNVRVQPAKTGNSMYVTGDPFGNPPRPGSPQTMVRIPSDEHIGRAARGREPGSRFDTGTDPQLPGGATRRDPVDERLLVNEAGEPYADPEALVAALKWRAGGLVRPEQAPRGIRQQPPLEAEPRPRPEGPDMDPNQLKLLSGGVPIKSDGGWETTVQREPDAGRFSRPVYSADADLARETNAMAARMAEEANITNRMAGFAKFPDRIQQISREEDMRNFRAALEQIDSMGVYEPGPRESSNVIDVRTLGPANTPPPGFILDEPAQTNAMRAR